MDVICLGILVADVFVSPVDSLPDAGELKTTDRFLLSVGGSAANTVIDLRRLNRRVAVFGKVGEDLFGVRDRRVRAARHRHSNVKRSHTLPTSSTVILNVRGEDRPYLHCIGANAGLSLADVDFSCLGDSRVLYVGGYLACQVFAPTIWPVFSKRQKEVHHDRAGRRDTGRTISVFIADCESSSICRLLLA
jgi:sugar/nucleoside kinase (ribokinase family)